MAALNLSALDNTAYRSLGAAEMFGAVEVHRYQLVLPRNGKQDAINIAAQAVERLVGDNPSLILVSPVVAPETLRQSVERRKFLVINGDAVCLSEKEKAPEDLDLMAKDILFSGAIVKEPVKCSNGHIMEKVYADVWFEKKGNVCPYQQEGEHQLGPRVVSPFVQAQVRQIQDNYERDHVERQSMKDRLKHAEEVVAIQQAKTSALMASVRPGRSVEAAGGVIKVGTKIIGAAAIKTTCSAGKTAAQCSLHTVGKKLPLVALGVGIIMAGRRIYQGYYTGDHSEYLKAILEVAAGAAATVPGWGTVASLAIDAALFAHDISIIKNGQPYLEIDVKKAHETLGLDPTKAYSKCDINKAYKKLAKVVHSDKWKALGDHLEDEMNQTQSMINACKDLLYSHYGFTEAA